MQGSSVTLCADGWKRDSAIISHISVRGNFRHIFKAWQGGEPITAYPGTDRELGFMLYDMDYSDPENIHPQFFQAVLHNSVLDVRDCEVYR